MQYILRLTSEHALLVVRRVLLLTGMRDIPESSEFECEIKYLVSF